MNLIRKCNYTARFPEPVEGNRAATTGSGACRKAHPLVWLYRLCAGYLMCKRLDCFILLRIYLEKFIQAGQLKYHAYRLLYAAQTQVSI